VGDYAVNIGTTGLDVPYQLGKDGPWIYPNGAFEAEHGLRYQDFTDGLSNTLMVGEKHVPAGLAGQSPWDCGIYDGHNWLCNMRGAGPLMPLASSAQDTEWKFGSAHTGICQFVFADGSVKSLANSIDPVVLGRLAQRNDGLGIPEY
jgi:hypothetical protein